MYRPSIYIVHYSVQSDDQIGCEKESMSNGMDVVVIGGGADGGGMVNTARSNCVKSMYSSIADRSGIATSSR